MGGLCDTTPKHLDGLCEQLGQDENLSGLRREDILDGYWMTAHFHPLWTLYGEFLKLFPLAGAGVRGQPSRRARRGHVGARPSSLLCFALAATAAGRLGLAAASLGSPA